MSDFRIAIIALLLIMLPILPSHGETASNSVPLEKVHNENWLQRRVSSKLLENEKNQTRAPDLKWKFKPGLSFRMGRKGINMAIGPRLGLSKRTSQDGQFTLNGMYQPLVFSDLKSGSRIDYTRFDFGYRHFLSKKMFAGVGYSLHSFSPSGEFREEIAARGGNVDKRTISTTAISAGHQVFKIAWSYRGRKQVWPFFFELTYQFADDYQYGADIGQAGSDYRLKSGLSFRIRPLVRKF